MKLIEILRQKQWATIFVIYTRYLIGGAFVFSSIVKIQGGRFTADDASSAPINSAWHLFETLYQSGLYWSFLGWSQLLAGLLLMTQRYATLGAVLFFPITLNIFFITISYYFSGTPIITGLLVLANIFLLLWDYDKLLPLIQPNKNHVVNTDNKMSTNILWTYTGVLLFLITVVYVIIWDRNPLLWFGICLTLGLSALIFNTISQRKKRQNTVFE
jgi:hypothetical protein